jgi:predicted RNA-binding protein associated with RNAse of E/G family
VARRQIRPAPKRLSRTRALGVADRAHSLSVLWDAEWNFRSWYVDLQEPLRRTRLGFDTRDQALDVVVEPDGTWHWKDEDHLAELTRLGAFTAAESAAIRAEGQRVIDARPWPTGWEEWRPDPAWSLPMLPPDWNA